MKKGTIAILVGIIVGGLFVALGEVMSTYIFPPENPAPADPTLMSDYIENEVPLTSKIVVVMNWIIAAFVTGIVSTFISGRTSPKPMLASTGVLTILTLMNILIIPHPKWMWIACLLVFIPIGYVAYFLIRKKKTDEIA
jgi:hypothetical protein